MTDKEREDLLIDIENWLLHNFWNSESYPSTYYQEEPDIELASKFNNLDHMINDFRFNFFNDNEEETQDNNHIKND